MIRTGRGGIASVGTELCMYSTTREEREAILEREARLKAWRKTLPKKKPRAEELPGPLTWVSLGG